jgi:predicted type IV restriction endonuclease
LYHIEVLAMPLDDLVTVIETLQGRIEKHGASLRENETRTRMALIDPLLQVLGWDTADPGLVTPEYNVSGRKADYALLKPHGQPAATVEAKKLGESLESHRMQMLNYSNASGVEYAGLTDGNRWELYEVFERGPLEDRRILNITLAGTPAHQLALQFLLL